MKNIHIGESTRLVSDLIEQCLIDDISGILVLLDFGKAYDSLEWNFIQKKTFNILKFWKFHFTMVKYFLQ